MMFICPINFAPLKMDSVLKKQQQKQQQKQKTLELKLKVCTLVTF